MTFFVKNYQSEWQISTLAKSVIIEVMTQERKYRSNPLLSEYIPHVLPYIINSVYVSSI